MCNILYTNQLNSKLEIETKSENKTKNENENENQWNQKENGELWQ